MSNRLEKLITAIDSVKKEAYQEIAEPIQALINMVHKDELYYFSIKSSIAPNKNGFHHGNLTVSFGTHNMPLDSKIILGSGNIESQYLDSLLIDGSSPEVIKQLVSINKHLTAINEFLSDAIPAKDSEFFFSQARINHEGYWSQKEKRERFPIVPSYLEEYVRIQGSENAQKNFTVLKPKLK